MTFEWDVFVSFTQPDQQWAEWVAWRLEQLPRSDGRPLRVLVQSWDLVTGTSWSQHMADGIGRSERTAAILSPAYLTSDACAAEWQAAWRSDLLGRKRRLLPFRVVDFVPPPPFDGIVWTDLFGVDEATAATRLAEAVSGVSRRPSPTDLAAQVAPLFPPPGGRESSSRPDPPHADRIWRVPGRGRMFVGRKTLLRQLRETVENGDPPVACVLYGMSGAGKTQLAVEYAHRFRESYQLVWWLSAGRTELLVDGLAALAARLGFATGPTGTMEMETIDAVREALRERADWLLVVDDAEDPADVLPLLPDGPGHLLILSRHSAWTQVTGRLRVGEFERSDSVAFLKRLLPALAPADAERVAHAVGDLPLALGQAAGFMIASGLAVDDYLEILDSSVRGLLAQGGPPDHPTTLAAAWRLSFDHLIAVDAAAAELLGLLSFLAAQPVPLRWLVASAAAQSTGPLATIAASRLEFARTVARINQAGMASVDTDSIQLHPLVQAFVREALDSGVPRRARLRQATGFAMAVAPPETWNPAVWDVWSVLLPHVLAVVEHVARTGGAVEPEFVEPGVEQRQVCRLLDLAGGYLLSRGEVRPAKDVLGRGYALACAALGQTDRATLALASNLAYAMRDCGELAEAVALDRATFASRRRILGEDHPETLISASNLAVGLRELRDLAPARVLDSDVLARSRRVLGPDHPETLISEGNLALDLKLAGELTAARELNEDLLARRVRVVGADHVDTLIVAHNLASVLRASGELAAARSLDQDTLARRRRILGDDHPETLQSANALAADLRTGGRLAAARDQDEDTLTRRRRVLGPAHPDTLESAHNLAADLRALGDPAAAVVLDQDIFDRLLRRHGPDHPDTLDSANSLAGDRRVAGDAVGARDLDADTLARRRRVLGPDHPDTLISEHNLAVDLRLLGDPAAARIRHVDTLARLRRVLGDDHPLTMASASNLAAALRDLGEVAEASNLDEQALARRRALLGEDHPHTLTSAHNLALDLAALGRPEEATATLTDVLRGRELVLGADHPDTVATRDVLTEIARRSGTTDEGCRG